MKKAFLAVICLLLVYTGAGCEYRAGLETLGIVQSGLYKTTDDGGIEVTLEMLNPNSNSGQDNSGSGSTPAYRIISGRGSNAAEAYDDISSVFDRVLYYPHVTVRFFSEDLARKDLAGTLDLLARNREFRESALIVVIRDNNIDKLYESSMGNSSSVAEYISQIEKTQPGISSTAVFIQTLEFMRDYYSDGKQPVAGVVEVVKKEDRQEPLPDVVGTDQESSDSGGEETDYQIRYGGLAAFKDTRLVGFLSEEETSTYNLIVGGFDSGDFTLKTDEGTVVAEVKESSSSIKTDIKKRPVSIKISVSARMLLDMVEGHMDIEDPEVLKKIEQSFNEKVKKDIEAVVARAQSDFESDIFGFGEYAHMQSPKEWKQIKHDWDAYFSGARVEVEVQSSVNRLGKFVEPFGRED